MASAGLLLVAAGLIAFAWGRLSGTEMPTRAASGYLRSQGLKYLPFGGAAQVVAQIGDARNLGSPGAGGAYAAFVVITVVSAAAVTGIGALLVRTLPSWLGFALVATLLAHPGMFRWLGKVVGRRVSEKLGFSVLPTVGAWTAGLTAMVLAFVFVALSYAVLATGSGLDWGSVGVAGVASWLAGFLAIPIPAGLGVREAVFAYLLAPQVAPDVALGLAVTHRWVAAAVDLVGMLAAAGFEARVRSLSTRAPN